MILQPNNYILGENLVNGSNLNRKDNGIYIGAIKVTRDQSGLK